MDLAELKAECERAVKVLVAEHGYSLDKFTPADGEESLYAPVDLDEKFVRHGFIEPGVLVGTPVYWARCSYEYDEWDCDLASEILREIEHWAAMMEDDIKQMLAD